jgi:hypothetical protein
MIVLAGSSYDAGEPVAGFAGLSGDLLCPLLPIGRNGRPAPQI